MKLAVEIYTSKQMAVRAGSRVCTRLMSGGMTVPGSVGEDTYPGGALVPGGKRLAGLGRPFTWPGGGESPSEAAPGEQFELGNTGGEVALLIETDMVLDQGVLSDTLALRLVHECGRCTQVPLRRPDLRIGWPKRGTFLVDLGGLLKSAQTVDKP